MESRKAIGVFDSGVGGLTVVSEILKILPNERIFYFGDTAHLPYGDKTDEQIKHYVKAIIKFLKKKGIKALVMACNTSSALVLPEVSKTETIPTLGVIEFASKLAIKSSKNERIGVVANPVTVRSKAYVKNIHGFSLNGVKVYQRACPQWVPMVEAGIFEGKEAERIIAEDLHPLKKAGIDTLILGCTHYPYLSKPIRKIMGEKVKLIDPAHALAIKLKDILTQRNLLNTHSPLPHIFYVSGSAYNFIEKAKIFWKNIENVIEVDLSIQKERSPIAV